MHANKRDNNFKSRKQTLTTLTIYSPTFLPILNSSQMQVNPLRCLCDGCGLSIKCRASSHLQTKHTVRVRREKREKKKVETAHKTPRFDI